MDVGRIALRPGGLKIARDQVGSGRFTNGPESSDDRRNKLHHDRIELPARGPCPAQSRFTPNGDARHLARILVSF